EAYNLDGGGSSTMVFAGEVLNRPSDGRERPVATNIVITP
ncbi:MAG: phosphodiester glycosidase family protein, partial [bacterium]